MHSKTLYTAAMLAGLASAGPILRKRSNGQQAVYWGQNDSEQSLADYCTSSSGINTLILSFLSSYGNGVTPNGQINDCTIDSSGNGSGCDQLASDIQTCQAAGIKIFLSVGGGGASGTVVSTDDANGIAWTLWNSYANPSAVSSDAPRPFGNSFVNGWDFDIESNPNGNNYYATLINTLRGSFSSDSSNTYYISGAPQCPLPEDNMGGMIANSQFDYLWVQFYNNGACSGYEYSYGDFNFDSWESYLQGGSSAAASIYIGLPASVDAATGYSSGSNQWLQPSAMKNLVTQYESHTGFGGVMLWDAGNSDAASGADGGCTYAQEVASVLSSGNTC